MNEENKFDQNKLETPEDQKQPEALAAPIDRRMADTLENAPQVSSSEETNLADRLLDLAATTETDEQFLTGLKKQLDQAAPQKVAKKTGRIKSQPAEKIKKPSAPPRRWPKMAAAFVGLSIFVIAALFLADLWTARQLQLPNRGKNTPGAPTVESSSETQTTSETSGPPSLPLLPSFTTMTAFAQGANPSESGPPFPGTEFVLQSELPSAPQSLPVYRQHMAGPMDKDQARQIATGLGLNGVVYETYQWADGVLIPPMTSMGQEQSQKAGLAVIDGPRRVVFSPYVGTFHYVDADASKVLISGQAAAPKEQDTKTAESFLQEHGLLDREYQILPPTLPGEPVKFVYLYNGLPVYEAFAEVIINSDGKVASLVYHQIDFELAPEYPIYSGQEAWKLLTSGELGNYFYQFQQPAQIGSVTPSSGAQQSQWERKLPLGQVVHIYGFPTIFTPLSSTDQPLVTVNDVSVKGDVQSILTMQADISMLDIWGILETQTDGQPVLSIQGAKPITDGILPAWQGTLVRLDGQMQLIDAIEFWSAQQDSENQAALETFVLPDVPAEIPDGAQVVVTGVRLDNPGQSTPMIDWQTIALSSGMGGGGGGAGGMTIGGGAEGDLSAPASPQPGDPIEGVLGVLNATVFRDLESNDRLEIYFCAQADGDYSNACEWAVGLEGPGMAGIEQFDGLHVRVWGQVVAPVGEQPPGAMALNKIQVEKYEKAYPDEKIQAWLGRYQTLDIDGEKVLGFQTVAGETFVLADFAAAPLDSTGQAEWETTLQLMTNGPQGILEGVVVPENMVGSYAVIRQLSWADAPGRANLEGYQVRIRPLIVAESGFPLSGQQVVVDQVELVYFAAPFGSGDMGQDPFQQMVQPMWRFHGMAPDGSSFEIWLQAILAQYIGSQ